MQYYIKNLCARSCFCPYFSDEGDVIQDLIASEVGTSIFHNVFGKSLDLEVMEALDWFVNPLVSGGCNSLNRKLET